MMLKSKLIISVLVIGLVFPALQVAAGEPAVYKVFVDGSYGFYKVRNLNNTPFLYENLTLNINAGDTVIWANDDSSNDQLTIVSQQNLWDNKSGFLRYTFDFFNYTFTVPGTYSVYLKEDPRIQHQTIVVKSVETPTATPTQTPTATPTLTATVTGTPAAAVTPAFNLWYIIIAAIVLVGLILLLYLGKKG